MDADSSTQRHIELQSSEDLAYLLSNVRRAAKDHLDEAFPPVEGNAGEGDDLRIQIERYVNDVRLRSVLTCQFSIQFYRTMKGQES